MFWFHHHFFILLLQTLSYRLGEKCVRRGWASWHITHKTVPRCKHFITSSHQRAMKHRSQLGNSFLWFWCFLVKKKSVHPQKMFLSLLIFFFTQHTVQLNKQSISCYTASLQRYEVWNIYSETEMGLALYLAWWKNLFSLHFWIVKTVYGSTSNVNSVNSLRLFRFRLFGHKMHCVTELKSLYFADTFLPENSNI